MVYKCPNCGSFNLAGRAVIGKETIKTIDADGKETLKIYKNPVTFHCNDCGETFFESEMLKDAGQENHQD